MSQFVLKRGVEWESSAEFLLEIWAIEIQFYTFYLGNLFWGSLRE